MCIRDRSDSFFMSSTAYAFIASTVSKDGKDAKLPFNGGLDFRYKKSRMGVGSGESDGCTNTVIPDVAKSVLTVNRLWSEALFR